MKAKTKQSAPLYISEIAPSNLRGTLLVLESISIVSGVVIAFVRSRQSSFEAFLIASMNRIQVLTNGPNRSGSRMVPVSSRVKLRSDFPLRSRSSPPLS